MKDTLHGCVEEASVAEVLEAAADGGEHVENIALL